MDRKNPFFYSALIRMEFYNGRSPILFSSLYGFSPVHPNYFNCKALIVRLYNNDNGLA